MISGKHYEYDSFVVSPYRIHGVTRPHRDAVSCKSSRARRGESDRLLNYRRVCRFYNRALTPSRNSAAVILFFFFLFTSLYEIAGRSCSGIAASFANGSRLCARARASARANRGA